MNRLEFTRAKCNLIAAMFLDGEQPIEDYLKRSTEEQKRLFSLGLSECDGVEKVSAHQRGKAIDIYFLSDDLTTLVEPKKGYEYWHKYWEGKGGKPIIEWDKGHFEG
jgi:hypothetical protein